MPASARGRASTPRGCSAPPAATRSRWSIPAASSCGSAARAIAPGSIRRSDPSRVTPRAILETLVDAANGLALPHAAHIHCNNLGVAGNVATTLDSMRAVDGRRAHFTHLQFHSLRRGAGRHAGAPARATLIEYINAHPEVSGDVGQVMFGAGDDPHRRRAGGVPAAQEQRPQVGERRRRARDRLRHRARTPTRKGAPSSALQWVVGLELFLLSADPWRVVLSTDHPNGGSFLAYPELIRLLMDRTYRDEQLARVNPKLLAGSALADGLAREYTLDEIAIVTRAAPARLLGLARKGHLGVGADADVTVYARDAGRRRRCSPRRATSSRAARWWSRKGSCGARPRGRRLHVRPRLRSRGRARGCGVTSIGYSTRVVRQLSGRGAPAGDAPLGGRPASVADVEIRGVFIEDTFAEAFGMRAARHRDHRAHDASGRARRRSSSPGLPRRSSPASARRRSSGSSTPDETPDARPGVSVLFFTMDIRQPGQAADRAHRPDGADLSDRQLLRRPARRARSPARRPRAARLRRPLSDQQGGRRPALLARAGDGRRVPAAGKLRHAEEGRRRRQLPDPGRGRRQRAGRGRGGGRRRSTACPASSCRFPAASSAAAARSGARGYKGMIASTNDAYCPDRCGRCTTVGAAGRRQVGARDRARRADAPTRSARAMRAGIDAACRPGVRAICAGNYGGKLGPHHFHLRQIMGAPA